MDTGSPIRIPTSEAILPSWMAGSNLKLVDGVDVGSPKQRKGRMRLFTKHDRWGPDWANTTCNLNSLLSQAAPGCPRGAGMGQNTPEVSVTPLKYPAYRISTHKICRLLGALTLSCSTTSLMSNGEFGIHTYHSLKTFFI
jgi:hypothetical protein